MNSVLRLKASISGGSSSQAELDYNEINMIEGTYAARVYYTNAPDSGNDGAHIVEAGFWTMSDYDATTGTNQYSELDFEYLPNGGWDASGAAMYNTTWYNDSGDSVDTITEGSFNGWHTVVIVVSGGHVKYYDGTRLLADHSGKYYPRSKMNIIPQLWFSDNNAAGTWHINVDWVYYARNAVLTAAQVEAEVDGLRASGVARRNTVQ